jgi:DNA-binding CsgD family transcriptional regulator
MSFESNGLVGLSPRQQEILDLAKRGKKPADIMAALEISEADFERDVAALQMYSARKSALQGARRLTKREIEVLSLIAQGHSSKEAAETLYVSKRTVDFHLANVYDKLQVKNRVQAFRAATRFGLIPFEPTFGAVLASVGER